MSRIACVLVPHLDVQSLERGDPELAGAPLVVCEGRDVIDLSPAARALGLRPGMTIFQARAAARAGEVTVVAPGREPPFLAPLPVELLEPSADTLATLRRWGVRTIGELEALPAGGVAVRLGAEGAHLARVARGQADSPLAPVAEPLVFEEGIDFDWPVENVEPLLFVLRRLLENLTSRLGCRALASGDLGLTMKPSPR